MAEVGGSVQSRGPRRAILVVSLVLLVTFFAFPSAVVEWIADRCDEESVCAPLVAAATAVEAVSRHVGVASFFEDIRGEARRNLAVDQY